MLVGGGDGSLAALPLIAHHFSLTLDDRQATAHALLEDFGSATHEPPIAELAVVQAAEQLDDGSLDEAAAHIALAELTRRSFEPIVATDSTWRSS